MKTRIDFQYELEDILGSKNVYFQPPSSVDIKYPAIVYELNKIDTKNADNRHYMKNKCYSVTLIHRDPDNDIIDKLLDLQYSELNRTYKADNLNHYVFEIYY